MGPLEAISPVDLVSPVVIGPFDMKSTGQKLFSITAYDRVCESLTLFCLLLTRFPDR